MNRRPHNVTWLAWLILCVAILNGVRAVQAIPFSGILEEYHARASGVYLMFTGWIWCLAGIAVFLGMWTGQRWAWFGILITSLLYAIWYWIDRLLVQFPRPDWPFAAAMTAVIFVLVAITLWRPRVRTFFKL